MLMLNILMEKFPKCLVKQECSEYQIPFDLLTYECHYESHFQGHFELCIALQGYRSMSV